MLKWIADTMALLVLASIGYILCMATDRKPLAQLVAMVTIMLFLLTTIQDLTPTVARIRARAVDVEQKINTITAPIDAVRNAKERLEQNPIVQFGSPGGLNKR